MSVRKNDKVAQVAGTIPVIIVTGFLGSGKTTVLRYLLRQPEFKKSALIINEVGEIGIDQLLFEEGQNAPILLAGGCICCALVEDVGYTLRDLFERRKHGLVPEFQRVVIETTGLANPGGLVRRLLTDGWIAQHFSLGAVIAVADATNVVSTLTIAPEAAVQLALADRAILSKADLVDPDTLADAEACLCGINATLAIATADHGQVAPDFVLAPGHAQSLLGDATGTGHAHAHLAGVASTTLSITEPLAWGRAAEALDAMVAIRGTRLLRLKGILNIVGSQRPILINAVQGVFHPPEQLAAWPDANRNSRIVIIVQDLDPDDIAHEVRAALATRSDSMSLTK